MFSCFHEALQYPFPPLPLLSLLSPIFCFSSFKTRVLPPVFTKFPPLLLSLCYPLFLSFFFFCRKGEPWWFSPPLLEPLLASPSQRLSLCSSVWAPFNFFSQLTFSSSFLPFHLTNLTHAPIHHFNYFPPLPSAPHFISLLLFSFFLFFYIISFLSRLPLLSVSFVFFLFFIFFFLYIFFYFHFFCSCSK